MDDPELWSPAARQVHAETIDRVRTALARHAAAIDGGRETEALGATASELEAALAAMSEAEQALTGAAAFWLDLDDPDGPDSDDPDPDGPDSAESAQPAPTAGAVPVTAELQLTMDVTDADALLTRARALDPAVPITSIEDALFLVTGQLGWDQLLADHVDGVTMQGATARLTT